MPAGGSIEFATYYFRDRALAAALIAAHARGVLVAVHLEGSPRVAGANDAVIAMLADGIGGGLRVLRPGRAPERIRPYLHAKIYAFSHPRPCVLVGSFNPSGDEPEDAAMIAEIGDQDRGHNLLVEHHEEAIVRFLIRGMRGMRGAGDRFLPGRRIESGETAMWLYPRVGRGALELALGAARPGTRVRGAISHLKDGSIARALTAASRRGATLDLIVHDTERRVREAAIEALVATGARVRRYARADALPLHSKFLLIDGAGRPNAWFGSLNFNDRSRHRNHELLVRSREPALYAALERRFGEIAAELTPRS